MMGGGYIQLRRSYFDHPFWSEKRTFSRAEAWLDLLQSAAYRDRRVFVGGKLIEIRRGETVAAVRFLSDRWSWSNTKVGKFLEMLGLDNTIATEKRHGITVILITDYEQVMSLEAQGTTEEKRRENDGKTTRERQQSVEIEKSNKENSNEATASATGGVFNASLVLPSVEEIMAFAAGSPPAIPAEVAKAYWCDRMKTHPPFTFSSGQRVGDWRIDLTRYSEHWGSKKKEQAAHKTNRKHERTSEREIKSSREFAECEHPVPVIIVTN